MKCLKNKIIVTIGLILFPLSTFAADVQTCRVIHWQPNFVYTLKGTINWATHVILPTNKAADPVVGNGGPGERDGSSVNGLWLVESNVNHLYYKPTDKSNPDGEETTLSILGDNGHSYDFILKRVDVSAADVCVVIKEDGMLMNGSWQHVQSSQDKLVAALATQLKAERKSAEESKQQIINQQRKALSQYRSQIYDGYTWNGKGTWWGNHAINSIYDDGRWTYIRLNNDNHGVMSVYGMISGKKELLQYQYDSTNKIYQISGIFPRLALVYDNNIINIKRTS